MVFKNGARGWDEIIEDLGDPKIVDRARKSKAIEPKSGDIVNINVDFISLLPMIIQKRVREMGYISRYFSVPAMRFSSIIEQCLRVNNGNGTIMNYNSSILKKESLSGNLNYYAILHVNTSPRITSLDGRRLHGDSEGNATTEVFVIAIFERGNNGSISIISAENVMDCNKWIDDIVASMISWQCANKNDEHDE